MHKLFSGFMAFFLFAWLLPLGAFITPSQEKIACDGQRAFHMCSLIDGVFQSQQDTLQKVSLTSASPTEKGSKPSAAGGDDLVFLLRENDFFLKVSPFFKMDQIQQLQSFISPIEHPPQNTLLFV